MFPIYFSFYGLVCNKTLIDSRHHCSDFRDFEEASIAGKSNCVPSLDFSVGNDLDVCRDKRHYQDCGSCRGHILVCDSFASDVFTDALDAAKRNIISHFNIHGNCSYRFTLLFHDQGVVKIWNESLRTPMY